MRWADEGRALRVLDQTRLPAEERVVELRTLEELEEAIRSLRVRGAPLIGITAAMGAAALALRALAGEPSSQAFAGGGAERTGSPAGGGGTSEPGSSPGAARVWERDSLLSAVEGWCERLAETRPTAVNLGWALDRMRRAARESEGDAEALAEVLRREAEAIHAEDETMCRGIGEHALALLGDARAVLTHCNTGALATGGMGTALAPIYLAAERERTLAVHVTETRPLLQGSRLTAWELGRAGIDVTVIADGAAGALMARGEVDAVLVGADRVAANGDVANKVGTYPLAVVAGRHGIPFYVLAPSSTLDPATPTGADIPIEERDPEEIRRGFGHHTAPADAPVRNPAFDVTPAELVTALVTEEGVTRPPFRPV